MPVTHLFVNPNSDGADTTVTRPSDWNANHVISIVNSEVDSDAGIVESKLSLNFPTHPELTLGLSANGLSLDSDQVLTLGLSDSDSNGALSFTDWNIFNNKQDALGFTPVPNTRLINTASPLLGGGNLSTDRTLSITKSSTSDDGYLSSIDWNTFNNKQSALTFPLASTLGGTGVNNAGTITNASNTIITGGGTLSLGGFTLTVPATGTAALLATANVFTANQKINVNNANALLVEQDGVYDNLLLVDTNSGRAGIGGVSPGEQFTILDNGSVGGSTAWVSGQHADDENIYLAGFFNDTYSATVPLFEYFGFNSGVFAMGTHNNTKFQLFTNTYLNPRITIGKDDATSTTTAVSIGHTTLYETLGITGAKGVGLKGTTPLTFGNTNGGYIQVYDTTATNGDLLFTLYNSTPAADYKEMLRVRNAGGVEINTHPATNNAVAEALKIQARVTTAATGAANGFGTGLSLYAETATDGTNQVQGLISTSWINATNATRKANLILSAYDTAQRIGLTIAADGTNCTLTNGGKMIGFTPTTGYASFNFPSGVAPTSPIEGDMWNDSTQKVIQHFTNGIKKSISGVIFTQTADKNINNSAAETTLFGTGIGTLTLPTNYFVIGKEIRLRIWGFFSTTGNPNIQFKLKYGSTVLLDSGAFSAGNNVANQLFYLDLRITCRTTGATGTVYSQGFGQMFSSHSTSTAFDMESIATVTINTTTSNALDITSTWGTADASNTITSTNSAVEILN